MNTKVKEFLTSVSMPQTIASQTVNTVQTSQVDSMASECITIDESKGFWSKLKAFIGPGLLVAVGYMDPGNWATDIAGGSQFGYSLLSVIGLSSIFAMILQYLALKLGIVTGHDLAQACRESYSKGVTIFLWVLCEIAIIATDLAEIIGAALAINLLFNIPLSIGVLITIADVMLLLLLQHKGFQALERTVGGIIFIIILCFGYEILLSQPDIAQLSKGFIPSAQIVTNPSMLYIAIGILGATVMPHNLYLHSSVAKMRKFSDTEKGKKEAIRFASIDSTGSLFIAFLINASILIVAAAAFHFSGNHTVADIGDAYHLLDPLLGAKWAAIVFGIALLASGLNATLTGTLAGQIVMEGFLNLRLKPWLRRLVTRGIAIIPALWVAFLYGERGTAQLLVFSQVVLSLQLSFAVVPLVIFTSSKAKMGKFVNSPLLTTITWIVASIIIVLNLYLLFQVLFEI
ncbi:Nramp family divalent metal transporter [Cytophagaceae bacterium BD1B2-1]|uniref:Divalent metal cation transporter MntH n=1 Tax=Xanthocytophaga agilis TaxID=3048010 RepID=A0AAE3R3E1_9BACT|nr:Nramp family divalent metal transporter [Xanthocytophaga agilis]MDJ1503009.1 Nramp family divalent metal transporter [Xanthocytophaga agilis]